MREGLISLFWRFCWLGCVFCFGCCSCGGHVVQCEMRIMTRVFWTLLERGNEAWCWRLFTRDSMRLDRTVVGQKFTFYELLSTVSRMFSRKFPSYYHSPRSIGNPRTDHKRLL